jgi:hypothetical protein
MQDLAGAGRAGERSKEIVARENWVCFVNCGGVVGFDAAITRCEQDGHCHDLSHHRLQWNSGDT